MSMVFRIATSAAKQGRGPLLLTKRAAHRSAIGSGSGSRPHVQCMHSTNQILRSDRTDHLFLRTSLPFVRGSHGVRIPLQSGFASPVASLGQFRLASTVAATDQAPLAAATGTEGEEPIQGSAPTYQRHLLICTGVPSKDWVKKPELSDPYHNLLLTAVRGQEVKVNFTDVGSSSTEAGQEASQPPLPSKGPRHDLVLFPDNIKFKQVRYEAFNDLSRFLAKYPTGTLRAAVEKMISDSGNNMDNSVRAELIPGSGEPIHIELVPEPSAVLVCVHGSRDCRCGDQGGEFYQILKDMVQATGLVNAIKVYGVSHIGGHKYAPNTIMYPSGDWHGHLSEKDSVDAQRILFDALANGGIAAGVREKARADPIMIEKWRGRIGLSKEEQLKLYQQVLEKQERKQQQQQQRPSQEQQQPQSMFSAPGEDLYEDDGLKEQPNAMSVEANKPVTATADPSKVSPEAPRVRIVFETYQKFRTEIDAKVGERILDIVKDKDPSRHGVYQALECTCGGQLECATCHVYIEPPYAARLPAVADAEEDMLEYAVGRKESSRLGCQIKIQPDMEGMVVKLPQY
ncbi:MAG: Sucrase/ferredoxin-like-domain-containing protein [Benniella sp.]|nr:MAG: Sucrase/ferredoxin-like-domain-containing protein [Benniella sp.]